MKPEEWRPIADYEDCYEVSSLGRVRNTRTGRLLSSRGKRTMVQLYRNGRGSPRRIARLVAIAFLGPPPTEDSHAHHKDLDPSNDHVDNLEWLAPREHRIRHAEQPGAEHHAADLLSLGQAAAVVSAELRPTSAYKLKRLTASGSGPPGIFEVSGAPTKERPYYDPAELAEWIASEQPAAVRERLEAAAPALEFLRLVRARAERRATGDESKEAVGAEVVLSAWEKGRL